MGQLVESNEPMDVCQAAYKLARWWQLLGVDSKPDDERAQNESLENLFERVTGIDPRICPKCGKGEMIFKELLAATCSRSPP